MSVPYELALRSSRDVLSSSESRMTLSEQVNDCGIATSIASSNLLPPKIDICRGKISKLEQEREHWMLESQLIQIKHEKEQTVFGAAPMFLARLMRSGILEKRVSARGDESSSRRT